MSMKIIAISGLKRALGIVVEQITDALVALQSSLSGAVAAEAERAQRVEAGLAEELSGILPRLSAIENTLAGTAAALDPHD